MPSDDTLSNSLDAVNYRRGALYYDIEKYHDKFHFFYTKHTATWLGTGTTNGQAEKGMHAKHDKKIPANVGNIGRFEGGQVKATLEHLLESIRRREEDSGKNKAKEEV